MYPESPMAPIPGANVNTAIKNQAAVQAPAMAPPAGGGSWFSGNQVTTTAPNGVVTQTGQPGFFQQGGAAQVGLGAIQTLGNLWNSFQQQKMAKEAMALQKESYNANMANQKKTYNTALEDRIRARYATEGRSEEANAKIAANSL